MYREGVANIDDQSGWFGGDLMPFSISKDLEPPNVILMKNGQGGWITMGPRAQSEPWLLTRWVVIASHY